MLYRISIESSTTRAIFDICRVKRRTSPSAPLCRKVAFFYAVGTGVGGIVGPWLFGVLIDSGSRMSVFGGYLLGAALMILAGLVAWRWGVAAERKPLEMVARPLTFVDLDWLGKQFCRDDCQETLLEPAALDCPRNHLLRMRLAIGREK